MAATDEWEMQKMPSIRHNPPLFNGKMNEKVGKKSEEKGSKSPNKGDSGDFEEKNITFEERLWVEFAFMMALENEKRLKRDMQKVKLALDEDEKRRILDSIDQNIDKLSKYKVSVLAKLKNGSL